MRDYHRRVVRAAAERVDKTFTKWLATDDDPDSPEAEQARLEYGAAVDNKNATVKAAARASR